MGFFSLLGLLLLGQWRRHESWGETHSEWPQGRFKHRPLYKPCSIRFICLTLWAKLACEKHRVGFKLVYQFAFHLHQLNSIFALFFSFFKALAVFNWKKFLQIITKRTLLFFVFGFCLCVFIRIYGSPFPPLKKKVSVTQNFESSFSKFWVWVSSANQ